MAFDPFSGFQVGQQLSSSGLGLGTMVNQLTERANQLFGLRAGAYAQGLGAEQQMLGTFRALASPEAKTYLNTFGGGQEVRGTTTTTPPPVISNNETPQTARDLIRQQYNSDISINVPQQVRRSFSLKGGPSVEYVPKSFPSDTEVNAINSVRSSLSDIEGIVSQLKAHPEWQDRLGPIHPIMAGNIPFVSNPIRQSMHDPDFVNFLQQSNAVFLNYRKAVEGLRLVTGGVTLAAGATPRPDRDTYENMLNESKNIIARHALDLSRTIGSFHKAGRDIGALQPYDSPLLDEVPATNLTGGGTVNPFQMQSSNNQGLPTGFRRR